MDIMLPVTCMTVFLLLMSEIKQNKCSSTIEQTRRTTVEPPTVSSETPTTTAPSTSVSTSSTTFTSAATSTESDTTIATTQPSTSTSTISPTTTKTTHEDTNTVQTPTSSTTTEATTVTTEATTTPVTGGISKTTEIPTTSLTSSSVSTTQTTDMPTTTTTLISITSSTQIPPSTSTTVTSTSFTTSPNPTVTSTEAEPTSTTTQSPTTETNTPTITSTTTQFITSTSNPTTESTTTTIITSPTTTSSGTTVQTPTSSTTTEATTVTTEATTTPVTGGISKTTEMPTTSLTSSTVSTTQSTDMPTTTTTLISITSSTQIPPSTSTTVTSTSFTTSPNPTVTSTEAEPTSTTTQSPTTETNTPTITSTTTQFITSTSNPTTESTTTTIITSPTTTSSGTTVQTPTSSTTTEATTVTTEATTTPVTGGISKTTEMPTTSLTSSTVSTTQSTDMPTTTTTLISITSSTQIPPSTSTTVTSTSFTTSPNPTVTSTEAEPTSRTTQSPTTETNTPTITSTTTQFITSTSNPTTESTTTTIITSPTTTSSGTTEQTTSSRSTVEPIKFYSETTTTVTTSTSVPTSSSTLASATSKPKSDTTATTTQPSTSTSTTSSTTTTTTDKDTTTASFMLSYGMSTFDLTLSNVDDACSSAVTSSLPFPIYGVLYTQMHICSNGIVSFNELVTTPTPPRSDHDLQQHSYLAPYFTDLHLEQFGSSREAVIYYHAYDVIMNYTLNTNENVMKVRDFVRSTESDQSSFSPTFLLVVTWDKVHPYPASSRQSEHVSFQLVLVTDGLNTFAFYIYFKDLMRLQYNEIFIGYSFKEPRIVKRDLNSFMSTAWTIDKYVESNGQKGVLYYRLTPPGYQVSNDQHVCLSWWSENINKKIYYETTNNNMPLCPCSLNWLWWDSSYGNNYFLDSDTYCSVVRPRWSYSPHGKTCCYDWRTSQYLQTAPRAGGFQEYHKITFFKQHQAIDARMKEYCCQKTNLCHLYYQLRPVSNCYNVFPFFFASFWGDPHIETLDKRKFTFNGWGEYTLVSLETTDVTFYLQSRTARAEKSNRNLTDATIFSAFAAKDNHGVIVHVELNENKDGFVIYAKSNESAYSSFDDYTKDFADTDKKFEVLNEFIYLTRDTPSKTFTAVFSSGISFNVSMGVGMLSVSVVLPTRFKGKPKGLLGNFDDDPTNDFMFPNGTCLPPSPSERDIFKYGQSWEVEANKTVLRYPLGKNHFDFNHRDFVPKFLDEEDPVKVARAEQTCGKDNQECIYDLVFTESEAVANNTRKVEKRTSSGQTELRNKIPTIFGKGTLHVKVGDPVSLSINGSDDGAFTYKLLENTAKASIVQNTDRSGNISFVLNDTNPVKLGIVAEDDNGLQSPALFLDIWLCSGCSGHGSCNFTQERADTRATPNFKYAACSCDMYWEGNDCENDFNGCASTPCSPLRTCTDNPANIHEKLQRAYNCSSCPRGYTDGKNDSSKCEDIDECSKLFHGCSQNCNNTEGSYYCTCNHGFRLERNLKDCEDINECQEGISHCDQICNNTYGGFICTCQSSYLYNISTKACVQGQRTDACNKKNCSQAHGCTIDKTGNATCFCRAGYRLKDNNICEDLDECEQPVCSQTCDNILGSFICSCLPGYSLGPDKTSCLACPYPLYGINCSEVCNCGRGVLRCDPIRGCVCMPGWNGLSCDNDIDECKQNQSICGDPLKTCSNVIGNYTCSCISGYEAVNDTCRDIDECSHYTLNTCEHICSNTVGGYTCGCKSGYNIDKYNNSKCADIDECITDQSGCEQVCENTPGRFACSCYFGYELSANRKACKRADPNINYGNMQCSQLLIVDVNEHTAICGCNKGFRLGSDNQTCIDVNECTEKNGTLNTCSEKNSCRNTNGSYLCTCHAGNQLDKDGRTCIECDHFHYGINCAEECKCEIGADTCDRVTGCVCKSGWTGEKCDMDEDECSTNGICSGTHIYCSNSLGSYQCLCEQGYKMNLTGLCIDIDECHDRNLQKCAHNCTNTIGSYICSCHAGFIQNGTECNDIDECKGVNECSQICSNTEGNYRCSCKEGFRLNIEDRRSCLPADQCDSASLTHCETQRALCVFRNMSSECYCANGYQNSSHGCIDINECENYPCSEHCSNTNGSYICSCNTGKELGADGLTCMKCRDGRYGDNCTRKCKCNITNTNSCSPENGSCACKTGWTGSECQEDVPECNNTEAICPENSNCLELPGTYLCQCNIGYIKTNNGTCSTCASNRYGQNCNGNCTCHAPNTVTCDHVHGTCKCKSGWKGQNCNDDVDECITESNLCNRKHQTCINTQGSYRCICSPGYTMDINEHCIDIDECLEGLDSCPYGCENTDGNYTCICYIGAAGDGILCTKCPRNKWGKNCTNTCQCVSGNTIECNKVTGCKCYSNWTGSNCSQDKDECRDNLCPANSFCHNFDGGFNCTCKPGFSKQFTNKCIPCSGNTFGENCLKPCPCNETNALNPIQSCDHITGMCICNFFWLDNCTSDRDECNLTIDVCSTTEHSYCTNTPGGYECKCVQGYEKVNNSRNCRACSSNRYGQNCNGNCTCHAANTVACDHVHGTCKCKSGWKGQNCSDDVDECITESNVCNRKHQTCINTQGSYRCICSPGYTIDINEHCIDIDECLVGLDSCPFGCENTHGDYTCVCNAGTAGDGINCTECPRNKWGKNCTNTCECVSGTTIECNKVTGCKCYSNWTGSNCSQDKDECRDNLCPPNSFCQNVYGGFNCTCMPGFSKDKTNKCVPCSGNTFGEDCSKPCPCNEINAQNPEQSCDHITGMCICNFFWLDNCTSDRDECNLTIDVCSTIEHSYCTNIPGGYECKCVQGYEKVNNSRNCRDINECDIHPCHNGGNCTNTNGFYTCKCPVGWKGDNCTKDINECDIHPCDNGGNCNNTNDSYTCKCPVGWEGANCTNVVDPCIKGTHNCTQICNHANKGFRCSCFSDYEENGYNCEAIPVYTVSVTFTFDFDLKSESLGNPYTYEKYRSDVYTTMSEYFKGKLGNNSVSIKIIELTMSISLRAKILASTPDTERIKTLLLQEVLRAYDVPFVINGTTVRIKSIQSNNQTINRDKCQAAAALNQGCQPGYECIIEDNNQVCRPPIKDINECNIHPCHNGGNCTNTKGSYKCKCPVGWEGANCNVVDPCIKGTHNCTQICNHANKGYSCSCFSDYEENGYNCEARPVYTVSVTFTFDFDLKSESLGNPYTYEKYRSDVYTTMSEYFKRKLGINSVSITIIELTMSINLIAKILASIPDTERIKTLFLQEVLRAYDVPFVINGTTVTIKSIQSNNQTINRDKCQAAAALNQGCQPGYECIIEDNNQVCRPLIKDNFNLIVGLGVGIPLGILCVMVVIVLVCYCIKARKRRFSDSSSYNERSRASGHGSGVVSGGREPSRFSGYDRPLPGPHQRETDSDMSSASFHHRLSIQRTRNSLYQGLTNGASDDQERQQRRARSPYDFLSDYINPDEAYEIIRPHTDVLPNPFYSADG